jgi:hypothetical protein
MDTFYPPEYRRRDKLMKYFEILLEKIQYDGVEAVDREANENLSGDAYEEWLLTLKDFLDGEEK